jgi:hypothetical protein
MAEQQRRGRPPLHVTGGNLLSRAPYEPDDGVGPYSRKELLRMDSDFVTSMRAAIERGLERRPESEAPERAA